MSDALYELPADLAADTNAYEQDVRRFCAGELPSDALKAKHVPRGGSRVGLCRATASLLGAAVVWQAPGWA